MPNPATHTPDPPPPQASVSGVKHSPPPRTASARPRLRPRRAPPAPPPIHFGTDGWRAVIADTFTFANVARVAQATADFWRSAGRKRVVVGYDRRFLSEQFARVTGNVLLANGYAVTLSQNPIPTPAVSFAVKALGAAGGVMITASHNPPIFNGYKVKAAYGGPASPADCARIEQLLDHTPVPAPSQLHAGDARTDLQDLLPPWLAAVRRQVEFQAIARSGLRFAHDAMFGVGAGAFDRLLADTACRVTTLRAQRDAYFGGINPEPIPQNYAETSAYLRRHPHDLCLVTDGDADRIGALDGRGHPLSTHQVICLLLEHLLTHRQARGRMVKALTTTSMVDRICADHGIDLVETGVGFKHITAEMIRGGVLLGAEESGGIGFPEHLPERDGVLAGMFLLEMLAVRRRSVNRLISDLERRYGRHRYCREDLRCGPDESSRVMEFCRAQPPARLGRSAVTTIQTSDGVKCIARDGSWLMFRSSGTEPVVRVYAESASDEAARALVRQGRHLLRAAGFQIHAGAAGR